MRTREKLAAAIRELATEPRHEKLAMRADAGEFDDYADTHVCPITELVRVARQFGLHRIAARAANGEFDATKEESEEWARSPAGQEVAKQLSPEMRAALGMGLKN